MTHVSDTVLSRYAALDPGLEPDGVWAIEAHLERCGGCRARLRTMSSPEDSAFLAGVRHQVAAAIAVSPRMPRRARLGVSLWSRPLLPRVGMTVLVVLVALGLDVADSAAAQRFPSLVLLLAPVAPLLGVAAAWTRGLDPAHELVVASPRAGLYLVLRRTLTVLAVVIPVLAAAGWAAGTSPARWLLPSLAFTLGALALGSVVGVHRAAVGLAAIWAAAVVAPSLVSARLPLALEPASRPAWIGLSIVVAVLLVLRRNAFVGLKG
ncbi:MAG TPA: hypothetical protein VFC19_24025 [Candidatus Limnocylindrales bacterium]|nr:hypothetical protein [Candidatus Limnocylindrales bacterium]